MIIIQLITELYPAGAERVVADLCAEIKKLGHNISVVSLQPLPEKNTQILDELKNNHVPVFSLNLTKLTPWRIFRLLPIIKQLYKTSDGNQTADVIQNSKFKIQNSPSPACHAEVLQEQRHPGCPLIIHSHLIHANIAARMIKLFFRKFTLINTIHIAERRKKAAWHFLLDKLTLPLCDCQTAVSKSARDYHSERLGIPPETIPVIYNGIRQLSCFGLNKLEALREEWGVYDCTRVIGSVGRLDWQKGYDIFLKILPELSTKIPMGEKWGVVILGEGPQRKELEELSEQVPGNIKVVLPGYRKDAASCIAALNLFVMPSRYEGFGLSMAEAMSQGTPVLSSDADSLPELLSGCSNGKIISFSLDNKEEVVREIIAMAYMPPSEGDCRFSIPVMAKEYLSLYSSTLTCY